jgi:hypothetical protein
MPMHPVKTGAATLLPALLGGCTALNPYFDPGKPHHTRNGFKNNYIATVSKGLGELIRWSRRRARSSPNPETHFL